MLPLLIPCSCPLTAQTFHVGNSNTGNHVIILQRSGVYGLGLNSFGQLGDGTTSNRENAVRVLKGQYPGVTYLGDDIANPIISVDAGSWHTLALDRSGIVYSWGTNSAWGVSGTLGDGTNRDRWTPVKVLKGQYPGKTYLGDNPADKVISVMAGDDHSIALTRQGSVYAWGGNLYGNLGDDTYRDADRPVRVIKGEYAGTTYLGDDPDNPITSISVGDEFSIAVDKKGFVYVWGRNDAGQLGINNTIEQSYPRKVLKGEYAGLRFMGDDPGNPVTKVFGTGESFFAITSTNEVYAVGRNTSGSLGDGTYWDRLTPVRVLKGAYPGTTYLGDNPSDPVKMIAGTGPYSGDHAMIVTESGAFYATGNNNFGQLGDGTNIDRNLPVQVRLEDRGTGNPRTNPFADRAVEAGTGRNSSFVLMRSGRVFAWSITTNDFDPESPVNPARAMLILPKLLVK